ncbi:MAG: hypothetical protein JSW23_06220 [Planctomycetota bacterium]|nr:MAG: hypothetical protein JSW23_06220 [Planctomycetota bacterium]
MKYRIVLIMMVCWFVLLCILTAGCSKLDEQSDRKAGVPERNNYIYPDLNLCSSISKVFKVADADRKNYARTRRRFDELLIVWLEEAHQPPVCFSSRTDDYFDRVPAGLDIIKMGRSVLPFVMEQICAGNFFFNVAARRITGLTLRNEGGIFISEQELALRWSKWWHQNCNKPEWNEYLGSNLR